MERLRYQRLVIIAVLVLALLLIEIVPRVNMVTSPLQYVGGWVGRVFYLGSSAIKENIAWAVFGKDDLSIIEEQQRQIELLATDKTLLAELESENRALKNAVDFGENYEGDFQVARVIGHDPNNPQTRLRINIGQNQGVAIGSAVTTSAGVMVGVVVDVQARLSTIELLKDPGLTIPVRVANKPNTFGLLQSPDGFSLRIAQVPKDGDLKEGDLIVTNTGFQRVPPNLILGIVGSVQQDPESLWQQAQVIPYVDTRSLDYLLILGN